MKFKTLKLNLTQQNIFFTADSHFGHSNVIKYCNRPFQEVKEMNQTMCDNWNNKVTQDNDIVFILGDFCFGSQQTWIHLLNKLRGQKYLIIGNHDKSITPNLFVDVTPLLNILIKGDEKFPEGQRITLCHYPMVSWYQSQRGAWQLYGHVHGNLQNKLHPKQYDVGVDVNNFTPISYEEIRNLM